MTSERILGILYDLTSTIGNQLSLAPLLTKTLQRLMYHTGYPCGLILLKNHDNPDNLSFQLHAAIGDSQSLKHLNEQVCIDEKLSDNKAEIIQADSVIENLPCKKDKYHFILKLPIANKGVILLLSQQEKHTDLPLEVMLSPVAAHLAKAIHLCQLNDQQKEHLQDLIDQRTKEVREREEQMRLLLASTAEGIFGLDMQGTCTFVNASALHYLGYDTEDTLIGKQIHAAIHHTKPNGDPYPQEECQNFIATKQGEKVHIDSELYWRKDGTSFPVEYRSTPILKNGRSIGQIVTFIDISKRIQENIAKQEARKKLEHTQRLESLGVLAGGIAHDFNNLLTSIMGNAALSQQKLEADSDAHELIGRVLDASESAASLCQQMLAYSGKGKFTITPINLSAVVERMSKLLDVSIHKGTLLKLSLQDDLPFIQGDLAQIQQVIMNLITNANEALGGENGVVHITTGTIHIDQQYLSSAYLEEPIALGKYAYIEVSDTGCGISKEVKERIFEPFFTTKVSGRGLGMSAMLGIVRGHHGALKIYTEEGKGTSIKVLLPISESSSKKETPKKTPNSTPHKRQNETILIVDDEEMVRDVAILMLESAGFSTIAAFNGQEGLEKYVKHKDEISLVLLDMMMPIMNGEETFQKLRMINPTVKVLLCSGYNEQDATQSFTGKGLAGFIQKPYKLKHFIQTIRDTIHGVTKQ